MSTRLTAEQKYKICKHKAQHPCITHRNLATWATREFGLATDISQHAITKILQKRQQYEGLSRPDLLAKRPRTVNFPKLEEALLTWILQCQEQNLPINSHIIKEKGRTFSKGLDIPEDAIDFSNGWLHKFQQRHKLKAFKIHGEGGSTNPQFIEATLPDLRLLISRYDLRDVYNMDETGLFYSMAPDKTIAQKQIEGVKKDKTRITVALTANVDGSDKLSPFIIGHASKPRCFNKKTGEQLGNNKKAWMTGIFFQEWLNKLNDNMKGKQQHILLMLDNTPSHVMDGIELSNIKVRMLPPNTTSKIQPMDAGIIASFKRHYRRFHIQNVVDRDDRQEDIFKVDQLNAMKWSLVAWKEITPTTISNCFQHTGLFDDGASYNDTVEEIFIKFSPPQSY